eukprot:scaffold196797_cov28-Tisochrysis_lutea.AAC.1
MVWAFDPALLVDTAFGERRTPVRAHVPHRAPPRAIVPEHELLSHQLQAMRPLAITHCGESEGIPVLAPVPLGEIREAWWRGTPSRSPNAPRRRRARRKRV